MMMMVVVILVVMLMMIVFPSKSRCRSLGLHVPL